MNPTRPLTADDLFSALEEYTRAVREAKERGEITLTLSKKTHDIIHSLPHRP